ncbi:DNA-processing protein DprA [Sulfobacillus harzensis]|uniref:DNA-binding protein n=1 Tax=Sulfobacillus harzensis TaxID=2729629 RepID=A0A7Y0L7P5_9FIRM|nr:DNA-processing protein DprA [Sulfobacillus harzensis]NMP24502.1 DNA-binding protein [Sulfobacillus harzensis]
MMTQGRLLAQLPEPVHWVGVIGSRRATPSELAVARHLGATLARRGRVVVSGLALGIDGAAHEGALSVPEGLTVAIVSTAPPPIEPLYPSAHQSLADRIVTQGAIVHPFSTPAQSQAQRIHRLLERDLLLAQWVSLIIVVADHEPISGGSRWAVGAALKRGIPVFRLDSQGVFHQSPVTDPWCVDWSIECSELIVKA